MNLRHRLLMKLLFRRAPSHVPDLSYANANQPPLKRWVIRSIEGVSGRRRFMKLYDTWRREIVPSRDRVFSRMLALLGITVRTHGAWPPANLPDCPLVMIANHPFGIGDGIAILSLAEQLGRPFKVMIHADLLRVPEIRDYSLPVDFSETREATKNNLAVRHEAVRLLREGVTIVIFPSGGVATAPKGFGAAEDLPWKLFPAKLVQETRASVIPVHFSGQNGPLFHLVSRFSITLRLSLLIREFARLAGRSIDVTPGAVISWEDLAREDGRHALTRRLHRAVFDLACPAKRPPRLGFLRKVVQVAPRRAA
ncbi:lysophospholipid acyltransferase family protein [Mesorhizobium sp. CAU 1741]|uniref:lysophospholipid acyltransferase family protein n=1 Tax=Mesorhizobium sp. CAU 1741 TaxID=3140366 RepID=UPI00325B08EF